MGQVQNGRLYIRYRSSSHKNEAEERKKLTEYISLLYIAKSTLKTLLTFSKVEKTKHESFNFVLLLSPFFDLLLLPSSSSSPSSITKKPYGL